MNVTPSIVQHEFIGLEAKVVKCLNPHVAGIAGKVVDETRNTLTILHDGERKVIVKDTAVFEFVLPDGTVVEIDGKVITGRAEDRIKKRPRRLW
ncbi:MAG TPA: ribonuclease P protein subunit [Candidatus Bathyarchaeota archaeon]|nr:ribonuclease P protein subunit [Candidatus Bathyarchaeota archaeon]